MRLAPFIRNRNVTTFSSHVIDLLLKVRHTIALLCFEDALIQKSLLAQQLLSESFGLLRG